MSAVVKQENIHPISIARASMRGDGAAPGLDPVASPVDTLNASAFDTTSNGKSPIVGAPDAAPRCSPYSWPEEVKTIRRDWRGILSEHASKYLPNQDAVEEVMQDLWLKLLAKPDFFPDQVTEARHRLGYLRKCLRNLVFDYLNDRALRASVPAFSQLPGSAASDGPSIDEYGGKAAEDPGPLAKLVLDEDLTRLSSALEQLEPWLRKLLLKSVGGATYHALSEETGMPRSTIGSLLFRVRARLAEKLRR